MRALIAASALCGLLLVAAGAAGAHLVPVEAARRWDNAIVYGFVHTLAALAVTLPPARSRLQLASGWTFLAGVILFSGTQIGKMLWASGGASPLDALTLLVPIGGIAFMAGWLLLAVSGLSRDRPS